MYLPFEFESSKAEYDTLNPTLQKPEARAIALARCVGSSVPPPALSMREPAAQGSAQTPAKRAIAVHWVAIGLNWSDLLPLYNPIAQKCKVL